MTLLIFVPSARFPALNKEGGAVKTANGAFRWRLATKSIHETRQDIAPLEGKGGSGHLNLSGCLAAI